MEKSVKPFYKYCLVPICGNTNRNAPDKLYFHVPRDTKTRKIWCEAMKRDENISGNSFYCCEDHFNLEEDTENYVQYKIMALQEGYKTSLRLKKGVVPHIFQCQEVTNTEETPERWCELEKKRQALVKDALMEYDRKQSIEKQELNECSEDNFCEAAPSTSLSDVTPNILRADKAVQVKTRVKFRSKGINVNITGKKRSIALSPISFLCSNKSSSSLKSVEVTNTKRKLSTDNSIDIVSNTSTSSVLSSDYEPQNSSSDSSGSIVDESVTDEEFNNLMRTGMVTAIEREPNLLLGLPKKSYYLIKLLSENIPLPTLNILISLKKIKLNESFSILGLHFGYNQTTIIRIFLKSIPLIAMKLKELIIWPATPQIFLNLPIPFREKYANVVSILDCLEIQIEEPANADHQALTWSRDKECNTLKYLVSYSPGGLVTFVSDGYGGRITDEMIVEDCPFLDYLPSNKAVMAVRGFEDLASLLKYKNCTLVRPPSVSESLISSKDNAKQTKCSALNIHIERIISRLREFQILLPHAIIDSNLIPITDHVVVVACGIANMQESLNKKVNFYHIVLLA